MLDGVSDVNSHGPIVFTCAVNRLTAPVINVEIYYNIHRNLSLNLN